jgi:hypothetical protein
MFMGSLQGVNIFLIYVVFINDVLILAELGNTYINIWTLLERVDDGLYEMSVQEDGDGTGLL